MTQRWSPIYQFSIIVFWGTFLRHHFTPCARQGSTPSSKLDRPGVVGETMGRGKVFDLIQQSRICVRYSVWMIFFTLYLLRVIWMIVITYLRTLLIETGSRCFIIWVRRLNVGLFGGVLQHWAFETGISDLLVLLKSHDNSGDRRPKKQTCIRSSWPSVNFS